MRKVAIVLWLLLMTATLAACKKKDAADNEAPTNTEIMSGDDQIIGAAINDTEITDEDIKMIEDFLNEVVKSVEGETASWANQ